jgi:hypothetical protein
MTMRYMSPRQILALSHEDQQRLAEAGRECQLRADDALEPWGTRAPPRAEGEDPRKYDRDLTIMVRNKFSQNHPLSEVNLYDCDDNIFKEFQRQIYAESPKAAKHPYVEPGHLLEITRTNPQNGFKQHEFHGTWFGNLPGLGTPIEYSGGARPGRRVVGFRTDQGYMNTSGRFLR